MSEPARDHVGVRERPNVDERFDVLAFGAHPDDLEVAMGGTAAKLSDKRLKALRP
jgi:LmbE family N-acetylglucosaminyl deacetylase